MSGLTSALGSLATYTDSEDEDIIDEEKEDSSDNKGPSEGYASTPGSPIQVVGMASPRQSKEATIKSGLVSYNIDDVIDDDAVDDYHSGDSLSEKDEDMKSKSEEESSSKSPQVIDTEVPMDIISDEVTGYNRVKIPPEPLGKPPSELQEKVNKLYERKLKTGLDMNVYIQKNKQFRNPSIYEKLIKHCNIDELGTNYPSDIYDPHEWTESSFYDELAKVQKSDMDRREKEKKERGKIEFVSGTAKKPGHPVQIPTISVVNPNILSTVGAAASMAALIEENKRKSKWDQRGTLSNAPLHFPTTSHPIVIQTAHQQQINLTTSATGTKSTLISAFGNLPKGKPNK